MMKKLSQIQSFSVIDLSLSVPLSLSNHNIFYILQINLRLILVSGKTKEFLFSPSDSAGDIAHHVFENWPEGELVIAVSKLRLHQSIPH